MATPKRHNLQALAIGLKLTNLQILALNGIGAQIENGEEGYLSVADTLSTAEDKYLRYWLENAEKAGIASPAREDKRK